MRTQIIKFLLEQQNNDGSWGFFPGKAGAIEPTAYVLMSLNSEECARKAIDRGVDFLRKTQIVRGAWPVSTQDSDAATWATALAGVALLRFEGTESMCSAAADFLLDSFGGHPRTWILRMANWMRSFDASYVEENLRGWKWNPDTANWVEPTSYALVFLKKFLRSAASFPRARAADGSTLKPVIAEGDALLYQRMCKEGGWNYGNAQVLGEELRPYPLTTAIALIALQNPSSPECQKSLVYLQRAISDERSALALCMAVLCFGLYGIREDACMQAAAILFEETQFFQNIRTAALALLAEQSLSGENAFGLEPAGAQQSQRNRRLQSDTTEASTRGVQASEDKRPK